jgi:hypothetical protein
MITQKQYNEMLDSFNDEDWKNIRRRMEEKLPEFLENYGLKIYLENYCASCGPTYRIWRIRKEGCSIETN